MTDSQITLDALPPAEIVAKAGSIGEKKAALPLTNLLPLSFLAGTYIAFGALFASVISTGMVGVWPYGFMKLLQGLVFSMGLILVIVGGGELFTGNVLLVVAWAQKKISLLRLLRNWLFVYVGNFIGSITVVFLVILSKEYMASTGDLGTFMLSTANA
ncbi:formate/nitrite transporter family protein, partial [bacterium]|nr:formate/nitrite transporter family protein [bacterium]